MEYTIKLPDGLPYIMIFVSNLQNIIDNNINQITIVPIIVGNLVHVWKTEYNCDLNTYLKTD